MTYAQAFLGLLLSTLGTVLGRSGTASWLPVKRDPASQTR
jgi:hypothetical protein